MGLGCQEEEYFCPSIPPSNLFEHKKEQYFNSNLSPSHSTLHYLRYQLPAGRQEDLTNLAGLQVASLVPGLER